MQLLVLALALAAYAPLLRLGAGSLQSRVENWLFIPSESSTVAVLVLAGWLLYRRWRRLRALPRSCARGPALLAFALGIAVYAWARYTRAGDLLVPSLMANALAVAAWFRGRAGLRAVGVPVAFLVFALPLPPPLLNEIVFRLQLATAEYAGWLLHALGQAALVAGDQILRADQYFQVIEGCSGMRSMETLTMIAVLLLDRFERGGWHAAILLLVAPPLAFALNGLRVLALILNPHAEVLAIHTVQGVAILLVGLIVLFLLDGLLARVFGWPARGAPSEGRAPVAPPAVGPARALPAAALALCAALSLWLPPWKAPAGPRYSLLQAIPRELGAWSATDVAIDRAFLGRAGLGQVLRRQYRSGDDAVDLFLAVGDRSQRDQTPLSPTTGLPGSGWIVEEEGRLRLGEGGPTVETRLVRSSTRRMLLFHWYEGTAGLAEEALRSALALDSSPLRRRGEGVAVRIGTAVPPGGEAELQAARDRLVRFFSILRGELGTLHAHLAGKRFPDFPEVGKVFPRARPPENHELL